MLMGAAFCGHAFADLRADATESILDSYGYLLSPLVTMIDPQAQETLCRKGNFSGGVFSVRSLEGKLCENEAIARLAAKVCKGYQDFSKSQCAANIRAQGIPV